jgi:hypothetical protein
MVVKNKEKGEIKNWGSREYASLPETAKPKSKLGSASNPLVPRLPSSGDLQYKLCKNEAPTGVSGTEYHPAYHSGPGNPSLHLFVSLLSCIAPFWSLFPSHLRQ